MCGIAGLMTANGTPPDEAVLEALAKALRHRGPDGGGRLVRDDVALVHTRLAIIDLVTGGQPLLGPDELALVANGEIYNHLELRRQLEGVNFRTASDCEPPLHLYARFGTEYVRRLRGMYAIALHDRRARRLVLSRDPFGIKPLYYAETPKGFAFASEPQALVAAGLVTPRLMPPIRDELLQLQFSTGRETLFEGVERLLPGETLVIEGARIVARHRIAALPEGGPIACDREQVLDQLDEILTDSVDLHQRSDVPYGMFLSGGIDSTALLALMARLNAKPVLAFTAGFPGTGVHDEREQAARLAAAMGAEHVTVSVTEADFWAELPQIAAATDDPIADYAIIPTYLLAREARKSVKVILSGEGGDELFGGYGRYRGAMRPWPLSRPMRRNGTFDGLDVLREYPLEWREGLADTEAAEARPGRTRLQRAQAVDCAEWLPNDLLIKLDRCLMTHGIEGRVPFLDPKVAAFAFVLKDELKVHKSLGKWVLRRWLDLVMPASRPFEPKRGFTVPVADWIGTRPDLGPLVAAQPCIHEMCRSGAVEKLFATITRKTGFAAWTLLYYALWHRRHILGLAPAGDVFETLAAR